MNITINVSAEEIEKLAVLVKNPSDATTEVEDAVLARIVAQARQGSDNDTLVIRRPRWAGNEPVTTKQIEHALDWFIKQDSRRGTFVPVFVTLHLVLEALKEAEKA